MKQVYLGSAVLIFTFFLNIPLWAQFGATAEIPTATHEQSEADKNGAINGKIYTTDGQPAAYVNITLKGLNKGTFTANDGSFSINNVKPGTYILVVSHTGLKTLEKEITIGEGEVLTLNLSLTENSRQLEEIIINGRKSVNGSVLNVGKLPVAARDMPQSIAVINSTIIADQQAGRLSDVIKNVNGVALGTTRGMTSETFYARGYRLDGNNILKNGSRTNAGSMPEASTLESVEVMKGSAAMLYGGVSGGAVINLVTKQPKFQYGGEISLRTGSYDLYKPTADIYGPITKNLAFRVIGTYEKAGSFRDQVHSKRAYINPSLLYKISDKTTLLLQADYLKTDFVPDFGVGSLGGKIPPKDLIPRSRFFNAAWAYNKIEQTTTSFTVDHQISSNWKLNVIGSYQQYNRNYFGTERIQADAIGDWTRNLTRSKTKEAYVAGQINFTGNVKTGNISHTLLIGTDGDATTTRTNAFGYEKMYDKINVLDPGKYAARTDMPLSPFTGYTDAPAYRYGIYAQDLISLSDKFKVLAGLRWSYQETVPTENYNKEKDSTYTAGTRTVNKAFSPKLGLVYQPVPNISLYTSYSNNFTINSGTDVNGQALKPSVIDQFEAGIKNDFLDGRLTANIAVYRIINHDLAQMAEFEKDGITSNTNTSVKEFTGETTSDGFEIDLSGSLSKNIYFLAGYSNNYMRYTKTSEMDNSYVTGEKLVNNTSQTANATVFYTFNNKALKGLKLGASGFYTGTRMAGWNNTHANVKNELNRNLPLGDFTTFDASIGYTWKQFSLLGKLSNITNELNYFVHENYSVNPIPPRQFSATVTYKF